MRIGTSVLVVLAAGMVCLGLRLRRRRIWSPTMRLTTTQTWGKTRARLPTMSLSGRQVEMTRPMKPRGRVGGAVALDGDDYFVGDTYHNGTSTGRAFPANVPTGSDPDYSYSAWVKPASGSATKGVLGYGTYGGGEYNGFAVRGDGDYFYKALAENSWVN